MIRSSPRVSIGLPVYNGARYLAQAIDSILSQSFDDFELLISDNNSTDDTESICRHYAQRDKRIKYWRNDRNIGIYANHNVVFSQSKGQYFKWIGHDDLLDPAFLDRCVSLLDADPSIVLCFSRVVVIDEEGNFVSRDPRRMQIDAHRPHQRLRQFFESDRVHQMIYGLIRSDVLQRTALHRSWYSSDRVLLMELILYGSLVQIDEKLFYHREHRNRSAYTVAKEEGIDARLYGTGISSHWNFLLSAGQILLSTPMSRNDRVLCLAEYGRRVKRRSGVWLPVLARELIALWKLRHRMSTAT